MMLDAALQSANGPFQVNTADGIDEYFQTVSTDGEDHFMVSYHSLDGQARGVLARRFDAAGLPLTPEFVVNGTQAGSQFNQDIAANDDGQFIVTWYSDQDPNFGTSSYFRRYAFPQSLVIAAGPGSANLPTTEVIQPDGLDPAASFSPYATNGYGANVGAGDIDGDGIFETFTGPGPSPVFGSQARAFRADGTSVAKVNFYAYGTLKYGVRPAGGDIDDGDGIHEILTAPGEGAVFGPHIRAWNFDGGPLTSISRVNFFAYQTLRWGARVAGGDVDGDGMAEILTAPGPGAIFGPHIRAFNHDGGPTSSMGKINLMAFSSGQYGATVGAADIESDGLGSYGDGYQEILVGRGPDPSNSATFRIYDFDAASLTLKWEETGPYTSMYGVMVAGGDVDAGDIEEMVTAPGADPTATADIIVWEWEPGVGTGYEGISILGPDQFTAFGGATGYGANVAVGTFE